ncbi:stimulator of interferon genes protein-like [Xenia sp. Carnegie-2017]|uniref:stimulator of interferon genes protein-like n=1 Tax=Xenia sp. Carnegie-2017 TaxID=2897299 RepID=UPI001F036A69|nr:stimulator of interferon genes protein-like [Xenia sp. Carnegie-2017]
MKEGNTTGKYFTRKEILTFPIIFSTALSLFGFLLRTLVDRLSLVAEEYKHKKQRYGGSWTKMIEACFGGVFSGLVFPLIILGVISIILTIAVRFDKSWVEIQYLVCIFSGIGIGYLVMQLFNLNTQSEIHISTILEENQSFVSNGLAWHYYINHLKFTASLQKAASSLKNLNSDKLLLLIPVDCYTHHELKKIDNKIYPFGQKRRKFSFGIYNLKAGNKKRKFAIQYVKAPLNTLREMRWKENEAVRKETLKEQVKLFYRKLYEILKDPPDGGCRKRAYL